MSTGRANTASGQRLSGVIGLLATALFALLSSGCFIFDTGAPEPAAPDQSGDFDADTETGDIVEVGDLDIAPDAADSTDLNRPFDLTDRADWASDGWTDRTAVCADGERRCVVGTVDSVESDFSAVAQCSDDGLGWTPIDVCSSSQVCGSGACLDLPDGYGGYCYATSACPGELGCFDGLCLTRTPQSSGGPCLDDREAMAPGWCNGLGTVTLGQRGAVCLSDGDCSAQAPVCGLERRCIRGLVGALCLGSVGCDDELLCGPDNGCQRGDPGDPCADAEEHCGQRAPICGPTGACQDGATAGDACIDDVDCASSLTACVEGSCRAEGEGEPCESAADCSSMASICSPDGQCSDGRRGDACASDDHCTQPFVCGPNNLCQDGAEGDRCDGEVDCGAEAPLCVAGHCQDGGVADVCSVDLDCGSDAPYCGPNNRCQPGIEGDRCADESDCDGALASICVEAGFCQDGGPGDVCADSSDCGPDAQTCVLSGTCESGREGARCTWDGECGREAPFCVGEHCFDGDTADLCVDTTDCAAAHPYCGPQGCQSGVEGDPCQDASQCSGRSPFCGPDEACHDGSLGDPCADAADCGMWHPTCGPVGCQSGVEGDPCTGAAHCSTSAAICGPTACQDGSEGDACADLDDCAASAPHCVAGSCTDGSEGDPCAAPEDCTVLAPFCGPEGCQDGSAGDACDGQNDCSTAAPVCFAGHCSAGGSGDPCDTVSDCSVAAPICGPAGCQVGIEGDPCLDVTDCEESTPICGTDGCQDGSEGDACRSELDCGTEAPLCASHSACQDGSLGDNCSVVADCNATAALCGPVGCQVGDESDRCDGPEDCNVSAPFCAPDGLCHDGTAADACADNDQCLAENPLCGPAGCQTGQEGNPCSTSVHCDESSPFCAPDGSCHDGLFGDSCADDSQCHPASPLCGPVGCQTGIEGDACTDWPDCNATAPICSSDGACHDGSLGDPCSRNSHCGLSAPYCGPSGCQVELYCTEPFDCDDGVSCTVDGCDAGSCVNDPIDSLCDNGFFCDGTETCHAELDCQAGTPPVVSDGVGCTVDSCDEESDVVVNTPSDSACDDGLFCNGEELCDAELDCQAGTAPAVSDGVGCTVDSCDEDGDAVVNTPDDSACDNGLFCDGDEWCNAVKDCQAGDPVVCEDTQVATTDFCNEETDQCDHVGRPDVVDSWAAMEPGTTVAGTLLATHPNGDTLTFALETAPAHGQAVVSTDGRWTFEPDPGFATDDSFTIRVTDSLDASATGTVWITQLLNYNLVENDEFLVNTEQERTQFTPAVSTLVDGGFVVVWVSDLQDGDQYGIFGQRFDIDGDPVGAEFQVNTGAVGRQWQPDVGALTGGGFVVTWQSDNGDGDGDGIFGQRFDAAGVPVGSEFQVNTSTAGNQRYPDIEGLLDGGFLISWTDFDTNIDPYAQRYSANGDPLGAQFRINTTESSTEENPDAAARPDGGFVVVWEGIHDGSGDGVFGQIFDAAGELVGPEFQVNTYTDNYQIHPQVATLADGGFVVTWYSNLQEDGATTGIYAQRFDALGDPVDGEIHVNTTLTNNQLLPNVTAMADGGFAISWTSYLQDGSANSAYARRFNAEGGAVGDEFQLNIYAYMEQKDPVVAGLPDGRLAAFWWSWGQDAGFEGVLGRIYDVAPYSLPYAITGRDGNDSFIGGAFDDTFLGDAGDDLLEGGEGADALDGGEGNDTVSYASASTGVRVYLYDNAGLLGEAAGDTLTSIENLIGSDFADKLLGDSGDNLIDAGPGFDLINGEEGNDTVVWDPGDDWAGGGVGTDTLRANGTDVDISGSDYSVEGFEIVDLETDSGPNHLTITADWVDVLSNDGTLTVLGGSNDSLDAGRYWTYGGTDPDGNRIYTQNRYWGTATLTVDPDVTINSDILVQPGDD